MYMYVRCLEIGSRDMQEEGGRQFRMNKANGKAMVTSRKHCSLWLFWRNQLLLCGSLSEILGGSEANTTNAVHTPMRERSVLTRRLESDNATMLT